MLLLFWFFLFFSGRKVPKCFYLFCFFNWLSFLSLLNLRNDKGSNTLQRYWPHYRTRTQTRVTKGLFAWREEDPGTRKILEGGITLRWIYMQKFWPVSCPSREG